MANVKSYIINFVGINEDGTDALEYNEMSSINVDPRVAKGIVECFKTAHVAWVAVKVTDDDGIAVYERLGDRRLQVWHDEEVSDLLA